MATELEDMDIETLMVTSRQTNNYCINLHRSAREMKEQKITKYRVIKDGVMSGTTAITNFEGGAQTAQITTIERYLDYLGYTLAVVPK